MTENIAEKAVRRIWSFSRALDLTLIDEEVKKGFKLDIGHRHGERVGYISLRLGSLLGLRGKDLMLLLMAGLIHDIGAVGGFADYHGHYRLMKMHSDLGADIVKKFPYGEVMEEALRYHHETPSNIFNKEFTEALPLMPKIISLADKVDIQMGRNPLSYKKRREILNRVHEGAGRDYFPEVVNAFERVAGEEAFWLDLQEGDLLEISLAYLFGSREDSASCEVIDLCSKMYEGEFTDILAQTFAFLIDRKSAFTGRHSRLVADTAVCLAEKLGWDSGECREIRLAGLLHDLGKLAVPQKVLDKPGPLDQEEIRIIRTHTYYTFTLLSSAGFSRTVVEWASYHHERLDGKGYPFCLDENSLDTGARLMAIADIYAALTEDRPYRKGMDKKEAFRVIEKGIDCCLDSRLVKAAKEICFNFILRLVFFH